MLLFILTSLILFHMLHTLFGEIRVFFLSGRVLFYFERGERGGVEGGIVP